MQRTLVLTLLGPDRPGLVDAVARVAAAHGANWVDSHMARLAGRFAGILRLDVAAERAPALREALVALRARGLHLVVEEADAEPAPEPGRRMVLELVGHDRTGIVHEVAAALACRGINVLSLQTTCRMAPMTGVPMFHAEAVLWVPERTPLEELRQTLAALADTLHLDHTLIEDATDAPGTSTAS